MTNSGALASSPDGDLARCAMTFTRPAGGTLVVRLSGTWTMQTSLPSADEVSNQIEVDPKVERLAFDAAALTAWDSGLLTFLLKILGHCAERGIEAERDSLPEGVQRLLDLATAVPRKKYTGNGVTRTTFHALGSIPCFSKEVRRAASDAELKQWVA